MEFKLSGKPVIHWWDHGRKRTCHFNRPGASADDSYVGEVYHRDDCWWSRLKGEDIGTKHRTLAAAEKRVKDSVNGEELTEHD